MFDTLCATFYYTPMNSDTVTITKKEYRELKRDAREYRRITTRVFESVVKDDVTAVVADFRKTDLYTDGFLSDLEQGLRKSTYGKA